MRLTGPAAHRLPSRWLRRAGIAGAAAVLVAHLLAGAFVTDAAAASGEDDAGTVTWSVRPADESGEDGRSWVEQELEPGRSAVEHLAVRNLSDEPVTFRLSAADGYFGQNGRFSILPSTEESVDAGLWIDVQDEVTVAAGETALVPFTTTVPEDATPGDHAAGIAASVMSEQIGEDGATLGVESRVGFRVMTRVAGELAPSMTVEAITSSYDVAWSPFAPGTSTVEFSVVNSGNARLLVAGSASLGGRTAEFPGTESIDQELLPGERRVVRVEIDGVWPMFFIPGSLEVTPTVTGAGAGVAVDVVRRDIGTWAIPWSQLLALTGVGLILGSGLWGRRRSRRRLELMLARAREEGRREAEAGV